MKKIWKNKVKACFYKRKQGKKRQDEPEEDLFEFSKDKDEKDISFETELDEKDIPQDTLFNKFVNWFRVNKD